MIVDTSAIMAILLAEPEQDEFMSLIFDTDPAERRISAGTWIELAAVTTRHPYSNLAAGLDALAALARFDIMPVTAEQAQIGHRAYRTYGRGAGHPARLNLGDCFAYALARDRGEPLLFKGDDFARTDVTPAR